MRVSRQRVDLFLYASIIDLHTVVLSIYMLVSLFPRTTVDISSTERRYFPRGNNDTRVIVRHYIASLSVVSDEVLSEWS